jgi:hypothetical protein
MTGMRQAIGIAAEMQNRRTLFRGAGSESQAVVERQIRQGGVKVAVAVPVAEQ